MQVYQSHPPLRGSYSPDALSLCFTERQAYSSTLLSTVGASCPAVSVSPGHVRRLRPYPPSRRRRQ